MMRSCPASAMSDSSPAVCGTHGPVVEVNASYPIHSSLFVHKDDSVTFSRLENYSFHDAMEFMKAFCQHAGINMHIELLAGKDSHHIIEGVFKATAKSYCVAGNSFEERRYFRNFP